MLFSPFSPLGFTNTNLLHVVIVALFWIVFFKIIIKTIDAGDIIRGGLSLLFFFASIIGVYVSARVVAIALPTG